MELETTLDSEGRIQLPDAVQSQMEVGPGDVLFLEQQDSRWVLCLKKPTSGLHWSGNVLVHQGEDTALLENCLSQLRAERTEHLLENEAE